MAGHSPSTIAAAHPGHPERFGLLAQLFGAFGPPLMWSLVLLIEYPLTSYACFPRNEPRDQPLPGWEWIWWFILALGIAGFLVSALAGLISYRIWTMTRDESPANVLDTGKGRKRFFGVVGILTSIGFGVVIASQTIVLFLVPLCAR